ncbi:MAG: hypothetical protein JW751_23735 [Polyangiaceae bacterium]|nr:hypothetical protein [Polyangiaceae bacterium]
MRRQARCPDQQNVLLALDHLPEQPERPLSVEARLAGLDHALSRAQERRDVGNDPKCQHTRHAGKGVRDAFWSVVDVAMEARGIDAKQALALLDERFSLGLRRSGKVRLSTTIR